MKESILENAGIQRGVLRHGGNVVVDNRRRAVMILVHGGLVESVLKNVVGGEGFLDLFG